MTIKEILKDNICGNCENSGCHGCIEPMEINDIIAKIKALLPEYRQYIGDGTQLGQCKNDTANGYNECLRDVHKALFKEEPDND